MIKLDPVVNSLLNDLLIWSLLGVGTIEPLLYYVGELLVFGFLKLDRRYI